MIFYTANDFWTPRLWFAWRPVVVKRYADEGRKWCWLVWVIKQRCSNYDSYDVVYKERR